MGMYAQAFYTGAHTHAHSRILAHRLSHKHTECTLVPIRPGYRLLLFFSA